MKYVLSSLFMCCLFVLIFSTRAKACTGITLKTQKGTTVVARTIEWGGSYLNSQYVIVPRGYKQNSFIIGGKEGMSFTSRYGYVGLAVEQKEFIAEGLNEKGLSAGLFYFPHYGKYANPDTIRPDKNIADLYLVSWILGSCATVEEVKQAVQDVCVTAIDPRASTVHWRFVDLSGRQLVLEVIDGVARFYENELGVLTNSPDFDWQLKNLNNYVNLYSGTADSQSLGSITLNSFGAGSGFLGLPGDVTPPSRFVRAAFYQSATPQQATEEQTVRQCFQILNNFDIPIGIEHKHGQPMVDIPSATQWTSATDMTNRVIYFRTMYNSAIRSIDLKSIDFNRIKYRAVPLDVVREQPILPIEISKK